jgi:hypothetical protein
VWMGWVFLDVWWVRKVFGGVKQDVSFLVLFAVLMQMEAVEGFWNASKCFEE